MKFKRFGTWPLGDRELKELAVAYERCRWMWIDRQTHIPAVDDIKSTLHELVRSIGDCYCMATGGLEIRRVDDQLQVWVDEKLHRSLYKIPEPKR